MDYFKNGFRFMGLVVVLTTLAVQAADKKIILLAGPPSHGPGEHEHRAGCLLLQQCLNQVPGIHAEVISNGWPADPAVFEGAAAVVVYCDGGDGHPLVRGDHLKVMGALAEKGVGVGCLHYAVEVPQHRGGREFLDWIGGYFETYWSVNPTWTADFKKLPAHPVARGVEPFQIYDEWYYHMRFRDDLTNLTAILSAVPPENTHLGRDDAHGGNPYVRARVGQPENVMWVYQRPDGSRGFGFTGGHYHKNWGNDNFRRAALNAIVWIAQAPVPDEGIASQVTPEDLRKNLDPKEK